jgi:iron(III)-enterobactin esterase
MRQSRGSCCVALSALMAMACTSKPQPMGETIGGRGGAGGGGSGGSLTDGGGASAGVGGRSADGGGGAPRADAGPDVAAESGVTDPGNAGDGDFMIAPPYRPAPELTVATGVPRGQLDTFPLTSSGSAIYPTDIGSGAVFSRSVWVYVPAQYVAGTPAPFMVVQDGSTFTSRIPPILDNMINDHRLPVMIAILINPGPGDGIGSERGREYDTVSDAYVRFVETEILPMIQTSYNVTLTTDPEGRAAVGQSSGGAAAFTMGWFRPDLYHRILTYSGSFVALGATATYPHGAWEYHEHLINESAVKPLRVFLEAAQNDNTVANVTHGLVPALTPYYGWLQANQNMAAVLKTKGYHYRYIYAAGAGHADGNVITQTLPEELLWLWRGYPIR